MEKRMVHDMPCACHGYQSYRYPGTFGWIMIGANSDAEAMREAARSGPYDDPSKLEAWSHAKGAYVPAGNNPVCRT